jgi:hypothetical protein
LVVQHKANFYTDCTIADDDDDDNNNNNNTNNNNGLEVCGSVMVEALFYKPEGRRFETRWRNSISTLANPSSYVTPSGLVRI